jgi:hypothetical protein
MLLQLLVSHDQFDPSSGYPRSQPVSSLTGKQAVSGTSSEATESAGGNAMPESEK